MRIATKVRLGFVLMLSITLAVSGAAVWSIRQLADMNSLLYDRALMSSTYAQSALAGFRKLQLLAGQAGTPGTAHAEAEQAFLGDLEVVESRTLTGDGRARVERVRGLLKSWRTRMSGQLNAAEIVEASRPIEEELTALTEASAAAGFESREAATALGRRTLAVAATLAAAALILATAASLLVARVLVRPVVLISSHVDGIADGDLTRRIVETGHDEIGQLATGVNRMVEALHDGMARLSTVAASAATLSEQLQSSSAELTGGAQTQAASLQETAASLEQMTATVSQSAEHAREAQAMAERTSTTAADGQRVALTAMEAMAEIARAAGRITEVTATVDELAFQTNLLALNAAVEAARAGDHGLGFAVVAAEVRNLARRSADAAREIKTLINDSATKVQSGSAVVTSTCQRLESIVASTAKVSELIAAIAATSQEHALGIDQVNRAVSDIERVTQENAQQTDALTAVAQELATQAATLRGLVGHYTVEVETPEIPAAAGKPAWRAAVWEPAQAEVPELMAR